MKKTFLYLASALLSIGTLSSCMPEGTTEITVPITYEQTDLVMGYSTNDGTTVLQNTAPQISITRSLANNTLTFSISYLIDPMTFGYLTLQSDALPYQITNDKLIINKQSLTMLSGQTVQDFSFTGFYNWMNLQFSYNGVRYYINTKYTLNMQFEAGMTTTKMVLYDGNTNVTDTPFDPNGYSTDMPQYGLAFGDSGALTLYMINAVFASQMEDKDIYINLMIPGLKYRMTATGYEIYSEGSINPLNITESGNVPYPQYVISNLTGTIPYNGSNGTISFKVSESNWNVNASNLSITPATIADGSTNEF